jgi:nicotinamide/nicotinate riboside kinase
MNSEGTFWKDPPGYFEQLVYPAYVDAHRNMFSVRICALTAALFNDAHENAQNGDVEGGSPLLPGLLLIEPLQMSMDDLVPRCCEEIVSVIRRSLTTVPK